MLSVVASSGLYFLRRIVLRSSMGSRGRSCTKVLTRSKDEKPLNAEKREVRGTGAASRVTSRLILLSVVGSIAFYFLRRISVSSSLGSVGSARGKECIKSRDVAYQKCTETRDKGYRQCDQYRDEGYNSCSRWDSQCCDWWPCSWACKLITWVCVAWYWISNIVCVVWHWVSNIVCVAWQWVFSTICVLWGYFSAVVTFTFVGKLPPDLPNISSVKDQVSQQHSYKELNWLDRNIAFLTTPLKHLGISGWDDLHHDACAHGKVVQSTHSNDGFQTIDLIFSEEGGSFTVKNANGVYENGINVIPPCYMRVEIFPSVLENMLTSAIPGVGQWATICGKLMWDEDGHLEIHPQGPQDIKIS